VLRARGGFTLLELLLVTVILSLLAVIVAGPVGRARERAMHAAAKSDLAQAIRAVEFYRGLNQGRLPATVADLAAVDYTPAPQIQVCRFVRTDAAVPAERYVTIDMRHRGSPRGVTTVYPSWQGRIDDKTITTCGGSPPTEPERPAGEPPEQQPPPEQQQQQQPPQQQPQPPPEQPPARRGGGTGGARGGGTLLDLLRRLFGR
jgi:prepilin-type N-terminal cleavage/methylation domain-containing protein